MRLLVAGSRSFGAVPGHHGIAYVDPDGIVTALIRGYADGDLVVIQGEAPGADLLAKRAAEAEGIPCDPYPADWEGPCDFDSGLCQPGHRRSRYASAGDYCPTAGLRRNRRMLTEGKPDLVVAFVDKDPTESRGTADMISLAVEARVPIHVVRRMPDD